MRSERERFAAPLKRCFRVLRFGEGDEVAEPARELRQLKQKESGTELNALARPGVEEPLCKVRTGKVRESEGTYGELRVSSSKLRDGSSG